MYILSQALAQCCTKGQCCDTSDDPKPDCQPDNFNHCRDENTDKIDTLVRRYTLADGRDVPIRIGKEAFVGGIGVWFVLV